MNTFLDMLKDFRNRIGNIFVITAYCLLVATFFTPIIGTLFCLIFVILIILFVPDLQSLMGTTSVIRVGKE